LARAEQVKLYRSFVKGLITEASFLTYPEDVSIEELNTIISRKGNRTRRFGIDYEDGFVLSSYNVGPEVAVSEFVWRAVNNDPSRNYLVQQVGDVLYFYSLVSDPISDSLLLNSVSLAPYKTASAGVLDVQNTICSFASGKGYLFVVSPYIEPIVIECPADAIDTFIPTPITIQIRDFEGLNDSLANDEEPAALTREHKYNLMNQGWVTPGFYNVPGGVTTDLSQNYLDIYSGIYIPYIPYF
jgi:hypothetical protein